MFASVIGIGMQTAQADPLLDEVINFNVAIFHFEHKVPALVIGVVRNDPRADAFVERMEADMAKRLAAAPERMEIPLAKMTFVKVESERMP